MDDGCNLTDRRKCRKIKFPLLIKLQVQKTDFSNSPNV
jgi:hypothetical protein